MNSYKTYTKYLFFSVFICLILVYSISTLCFFYKPLYAKAEYWIPEMYNVKDKYAQKQQGKKIIIASGSNSLFGINSTLLAEKTGYAALNLAVHANLPFEFLSVKVKEYAKEGDVVILPLEYDYYFRDDKPSKWTIRNFTTWGYKYLSLFSNRTQYEIAYKSILSYPKRFLFFYKNFPIRNIDDIMISNKNKFLSKKGYTIDVSTTSGECLVDLPTTYGACVSNPNYINNDNVSRYFIKLLIDLNNFLIKKDIKLFISYPCTIKNKNFDLNNEWHSKKVDLIFTQLREHGIDTLGNPILYNMERKNFYDTTYHLNAYGNILRSLFLADDFNKKNSTTKEDINFDAYKKYKEQEAEAILTKYRTLGYIGE